jgi:hypothetical protein
MDFVLQQAMYYFPLTNRVQAIYRTPTLAKHMTHHYDQRSQDRIMRIPADSMAWKSMICKYPALGTRYGNVFLGLATDGVNPYGHNASSYSIWPIMLTNLNLPPWLAIKATHMILSCIIPGEICIRQCFFKHLHILLSYFNFH